MVYLEDRQTQDEDLIPVFKCVKCNGRVCKDGVFKVIKDYECECIECGFKGLGWDDWK